jgi:apolipoprotein D and lipocalin family protein
MAVGLGARVTIIDLDPDYRYAVVGHPDRTYCWILARERRMDEPTYQAILARLREQKYDTNLLVRTVQPPA